MGKRYCGMGNKFFSLPVLLLATSRNVQTSHHPYCAAQKAQISSNQRSWLAEFQFCLPSPKTGTSSNRIVQTLITFCQSTPISMLWNGISETRRVDVDAECTSSTLVRLLVFHTTTLRQGSPIATAHPLVLRVEKIQSQRSTLLLWQEMRSIFQ